MEPEDRQHETGMVQMIHLHHLQRVVADQFHDIGPGAQFVVDLVDHTFHGGGIQVGTLWRNRVQTANVCNTFIDHPQPHTTSVSSGYFRTHRIIGPLKHLSVLLVVFLHRGEKPRQILILKLHNITDPEKHPDS
jgi:hypothetical protein